MQKTAKCPKCGSASLIEEARVVSAVQGGDVDVKLRVDGNPLAFVLKNAERTPLSALICGECGFVEFYAAEPAKLAEAFRAAQAKRAESE